MYRKLDKKYKIIILLYQSYIILVLVESLCGEFESDTPSLRPISGKNLSDVKLLKLLLCEVKWVEIIVTSLRIIIIVPDSAYPRKS